MSAPDRVWGPGFPRLREARKMAIHACPHVNYMCVCVYAHAMNVSMVMEGPHVKPRCGLSQGVDCLEVSIWL